MKATFFVVVDDIDKEGYITTQQLKELSDSGLISIQSHTLTHVNLCELSEQNLSIELGTSKKILESVTNKKVNIISYPYGFKNKAVIEATQKYYDIGFITLGNHTYKKNIAMEVPRAYIFRDISTREFETITLERSRSRLQNLTLNLLNLLKEISGF